MESNYFDNLTRQVAASATRRDVLKGVLTFTIGGFVSQLGFKTATNAYAKTAPNQNSNQLFLPFAAKICDVATSCSKQQQCGENCLCIESAEGEIRCGARPSCTSPKCTTSADCAGLGPGYFCDTPFSGCCSDNQLARCIPPCTDSCLEEHRCGTHCCSDQTTCNGERCVGNYDCETSQITPKALKTALAKLDAGATSVDLSPQGCIRVRQEVVNGQVVARSILLGTNTVSTWQLSDKELKEEMDNDNDGFKEWRSVTTFGKTDDDYVTVETEYTQETQKPFRRTTTTPAGEMIHFVVEEVDGKDNWKVVLDYETPRIQAATLGEEYRIGLSGDSQVQADLPCEANPCDPHQLKQRMSDGIDNAANCLPEIGQRALDLYMKSYDLQKREMNFVCKPIPGKPEATIEGWARSHGPLTVTVDPEKYCKLNTEQRGWILYHEVLHATLKKGHDPKVESLPEEHRKQLDRVYGCMALCYNNKSHPTRCMCAQCLGTVPCDPICLPYDQDCGATCPCPTQNNKYFSTCTGCLVDCPSGLACFGTTTCDPVGQSPVCPPVLCPP